jgi:hypothetical protein
VAENPFNFVDLNGLDWWNPFSWSKKTWSNIGTGLGIAAGVVGLIGIGIATAGVGDVLIGEAITVGVVTDIAGTTLGAASTAISCAQEQWISCGLGVASTALGGAGLWGDWGYAEPAFGNYFNALSTTSGIAGSVWSALGVDNHSGSGRSTSRALPAYSPRGGTHVPC